MVTVPPMVMPPSAKGATARLAASAAVSLAVALKEPFRVISALMKTERPACRVKSPTPAALMALST